LLKELDVASDRIDAVIFTSMTPDYRVPSTACVLQHTLGCRTSTVAYDINMGCSGFTVGLYNACSLVRGAGIERVLLLSGDTQTALCHSHDKNVAFILGDAGSATLVEKSGDKDSITMQLFTDGSRFRNLYVPAGGCRTPSSEATREIKERPDGGLRADDNLYMNGMEIFKFSSTDVVKSLASFMEEGGSSPDQFSYLFLHQANKFMNDKIAKKLKFTDDKVPYSIGFYGNTGSASIPLTIAHHFSEHGAQGAHRSLLCGFGVGLSWGIADLTFRDICTPPVIECA
jgi:3-oxoacyl-[acyl-carrier-protein] synthase-3